MPEGGASPLAGGGAVPPAGARGPRPPSIRGNDDRVPTRNRQRPRRAAPRRSIRSLRPADRMTAPIPSVRAQFAAWAAMPDPEQDLAEGALLIAAEEYPQVSVAHYLQRLELLAERVRDRAGGETAPLVLLHELNHVLFEEEGFRANPGRSDPRNCLLNDVIDRRLGISITLSIVYLEIGWRLGLPLQGIELPGHYVVGYAGEAVRFLVDPADAGRIRFEDEAGEIVPLAGHGGAAAPPPVYLVAARKRDILTQLLLHLKQLYMRSGDDERALAAIERILVLRPDTPWELRDRGLLLARIGRAEEARGDLLRYLDVAPHAPDARHIRDVLRALEGREGGEA